MLIVDIECSVGVASTVKASHIGIIAAAAQFAVSPQTGERNDASIVNRLD
jgi:hypothetical protein